MPRAILTGVMITHEWDNDKRDEYDISFYDEEDLGGGVCVTMDTVSVVFYPDSWKVIRKHIDELMPDPA